MPRYKNSTTRLLRTKAYQSLCVILNAADYEGFNLSTIQNANKALQKDNKKTQKRKAVKRPNANIIDENDENEPARLMEEFQKAEDFELCVEHYQPDRFIFNGRKMLDKTNFDINLEEMPYESIADTSCFDFVRNKTFLEPVIPEKCAGRSHIESLNDAAIYSRRFDSTLIAEKVVEPNRTTIDFRSDDLTSVNQKIAVEPTLISNRTTRLHSTLCDPTLLPENSTSEMYPTLISKNTALEPTLASKHTSEMYSTLMSENTAVEPTRCDSTLLIQKTTCKSTLMPNETAVESDRTNIDLRRYNSTLMPEKTAIEPTLMSNRTTRLHSTLCDPTFVSEKTAVESNKTTRLDSTLGDPTLMSEKTPVESNRTTRIDSTHYDPTLASKHISKLHSTLGDPTLMMENTALEPTLASKEPSEMYSTLPDPTFVSEKTAVESDRTTRIDSTLCDPTLMSEKTAVKSNRTTRIDSTHYDPILMMEKTAVESNKTTQLHSNLCDPTLTSNITIRQQHASRSRFAFMTNKSAAILSEPQDSTCIADNSTKLRSTTTKSVDHAAIFSTIPDSTLVPTYQSRFLSAISKNIDQTTLCEFTETDPNSIDNTSLDGSFLSDETQGSLDADFTFVTKIDPLEQLLVVCQQEEIIPFGDLLDGSHKPVKLGEGSYGEVFKTQIDGHEVALKIVPFTLKGEVRKINGDFMQSASAILPEAVISKHLSLLSTGEDNNTRGFTNVIRMCVVRGEYPKPLLEAWSAYKKKNKDAINESPLEYSSDSQHFFAIALELGGSDLEKFKPKNEKEAVSILIQVISSLQVAEEVLEFEHRDLHIGNVLIKRIGANEIITNCINGVEHSIDSQGVQATIIDFTNSRIKKGGMTIFLDLSTDSELFEGPSNEYQFDIYRKMREENDNDWSKFTPRTNNFWIHYLSRKLFNIRGMRIKRKNELMGIFDRVLYCEDLSAFVQLDEVDQLFRSYY